MLTSKMKVERWKIHYTDIIQEQAGMAILILSKADFRNKKITIENTENDKRVI